MRTWRLTPTRPGSWPTWPRRSTRAWRRTADGMPTNPDLRIEHRDGADRIVVTPLDAVDEPASLVELRGMVEALLPEVEIADLPLEVHGWTGFLDEYTHISGAPSRAAGLVESLSALLVSEACNVGLTPVVDEDYPPLTRDRPNWTAHNYFRSATHAAASTRLFDYHASLDLARDAWGGGEMASADGMRFVIPVATIHAGYNPRYFGRQRGSTLYTWMADTHSTFHQTLIPGTQRDSLYALDGLMANQTVVRPNTVSTDTAGASEIVFALAWATGYRYGPRLADLADHRLWVIDARADYGPLQGLARNRANTSLIAGQWDQICRLAASLEASDRHPFGHPALAPAGPEPLQPGANPGRAGPDHQDPPRSRLLPRPGLPPGHPPHPGPGREPQHPGPGHLPRGTGSTAPALSGRSGRPTGRSGAHGQRHRAVADRLHPGRPRPPCRHGPQDRLGGRSPALSARTPDHQPQRPLPDHGPCAQRRVATPPKGRVTSMAETPGSEGADMGEVAEAAHAGEQLQRLRAAASMTVEEVAERAGVDVEWLRLLEAGEGTHDVLYSQWTALVRATSRLMPSCLEIGVQPPSVTPRGPAIPGPTAPHVGGARPGTPSVSPWLPSFLHGMEPPRIPGRFSEQCP